MNGFSNQNELAHQVELLVEVGLQRERAEILAFALHLLGWIVFGLTLWFAIGLLLDAGVISSQLSVPRWLAVIPLAAAILSFGTAFKHDRELREAETEFLVSRMAAWTNAELFDSPQADPVPDIDVERDWRSPSSVQTSGD